MIQRQAQYEGKYANMQRKTKMISKHAWSQIYHRRRQLKATIYDRKLKKCAIDKSLELEIHWKLTLQEFQTET